MKWQARIAPSLGALEDTPDHIWRTKPYLDEFQPTVFLGLYGLPDFYTLWRHKGRRAIFWCGSDILHFTNGYWLDEDGTIKLLDMFPLAEWINTYCESYVENGVEHEALQVMGIDSKIVPSFLGKVGDYEIEYKHDERPRVYASVSGNNFEMYGWTLINEIAPYCAVDFYLYGNTEPFSSPHANVIIRGRVTKEAMNDEIREMQCGLRTLGFDGFSEILAKSVLWGQHPISYIKYPHITSFSSKDDLISKLNDLVFKRYPNEAARDYYRKNLNQYPFNRDI